MKQLSLLQRNLITNRLAAIVAGGGLLSVCLALPAQAHHVLDGRLPANAFEGFLAGLGHPVIGIDHFVFIIAIGLVTALLNQGILTPIVFVVASLGGTGLHLLLIDLPTPEVMIAVSVLSVGLILAQGQALNAMALAGMIAIAGLFHGYAYGESIVGAEMTPLFAYLLGFTTIQLAISLTAWWVATLRLRRDHKQGLLDLRFVGFSLCGAGAAFLSGVVLG